jgi:hypothetical protein
MFPPEANRFLPNYHLSKNTFMRKITLFTLVMLATVISMAQTTIKPAAGLTINDFTVNSSTGEAKGKAGFQIGGSIAFGKKFYFEPGIFFAGKSTEFITSNTAVDDFKADIKGIRVPVAVGASIVGNEKTLFSLRVFGGASGFFITSVGDDIDKDDINKANWGLFAGAGVDIWKIFVDASYEWSVTNLQKDVSAVDLGKSRTLFINAGIRINL